MVQPSKKDLRKSVKGKTKAIPSPAKAASPDLEMEDDESEWSEEDEDEENGGVSEKGMKRLMELVGEEDLDEYEAGLLAAQDGEDEDDDDEEEDNEEDEDDEEDEDEDMEDLDESEDEQMDNSVLIEEADPEAIRLDDLESNASVDEDAVPMRKVTANNKPAMRILIDALKVSHLPWPETLVLQSKEKIDVDPQDDLQREMAFYKVALEQVPVARKLAAKHDILFTRPTDYYAEMVKSDEHMERIRTKLVDEAQGIKKSEAAKRQRDLKKYGKQIQVQKIKQREMDKKSFQDKVQGVKRKRSEGAELGDEFEIDIDNSEDKPQRGGASARGARGRGGKTSMPRSARDNKYSLGGSSRRDKQNTKESTMDMPGWNSKAGSSSGGRGGRGGSSGGRGGGRGGGSGDRGRGGKSAPSQRPGKSRRK